MKKFEDQKHEDLEAFFLSAQRALPAPSDQLRDRVLQNAQALMARQGAEKSVAPIEKTPLDLHGFDLQIFSSRYPRAEISASKQVFSWRRPRANKLSTASILTAIIAAISGFDSSSKCRIRRA